MKHREVEPDYGLEFLLEFNGRIHHLEDGYWLKFEIKRAPATKARPHGLAYSFTLHAPDGTRIIGFDNAHAVPRKGPGFKKRSEAADHWHPKPDGSGEPYAFVDAAKLIDDFFDEVERFLTERGLGTTVVKVEEKGRSR